MHYLLVLTGASALALHRHDDLHRHGKSAVLVTVSPEQTRKISVDR